MKPRTVAQDVRSRPEPGRAWLPIPPPGPRERRITRTVLYGPHTTRILNQCVTHYFPGSLYYNYYR